MSRGKNAKDNKKKNVSIWHYESVGRRGAQRMKIGGELAEMCEPEKLRAEMLNALTKNEKISQKMTKIQAAFNTAPTGKVYVYKIKGEIKAVCIFSLEERKLPVSAAEVKTWEISKDRMVDGGKLKEFFDIRDTEAVLTKQSAPEDDTVYELKWCYVKTAFYVVPSYEEHRDALTGLFKRLIRDSVSISDLVNSYIWDDELIMPNMVKENGRYESALSIGVAVGITLGAIIGMTMNNITLGMLIGVAMGVGIASGTTTIINYK